MKLFVWLLLCVIWGTTWIFIKLGLDNLPPVTFAALRFTAAIILLLPIVFYRNSEFPKTKPIWNLILITGLLQFFVNYGLLFWGEQYISSGLAAVLQATIPAFGLFLAKIYVGESINATKIISMFLGLIGVAVIFWEQLQLNGQMAFFGSIAVVFGAFGAAYASVLTKAKLQTFDPAVLLLCQMFIGALPLWIVGVTTEKTDYTNLLNLKSIVCVLYLAIVGSIVAFWLYYWLLTKIEVSKAMMIAFVTPLVAILIGVAFRDEKMPPQTILGGILILFSVVLIVVKKSKIKV